MVYEVTKHMIDFAKAFLSFDINKVGYFSDGYAGQYKKCKNMPNKILISKTLVLKGHGHFLLPAMESFPVMVLVVLSRD